MNHFRRCQLQIKTTNHVCKFTCILPYDCRRICVNLMRTLLVLSLPLFELMQWVYVRIGVMHDGTRKQATDSNRDGSKMRRTNEPRLLLVQRLSTHQNPCIMYKNLICLKEYILRLKRSSRWLHLNIVGGIHFCALIASVTYLIVIGRIRFHCFT